jgi:hypothetical protein
MRATARRTSLLIASVVLATMAGAVPAPVVEEVQCNVTEPVCILVVPDGTGLTFQDARTIDGDVVDVTLSVLIWLYDEFGPIGPLGGFSADWLTIQAPDGLTQGCAQDHVAAADHDTGEDGWTEFTLAPRAGGWSQDLLEIYIMGDPASAFGSEIPPLPIYFNSPDIDGDLTVDLTDISLFVQDLAAPDAPFRSDLVWDGVIDLSDIAVFTQHLGAGCE